MYLGIDCGTQSLKALLWNPDNGRIVSASKSYALRPGLPPGHKEQHPSQWIEALDDCMDQLAGLEADLGGVRAIGVSGQQHGLVILDSSDRVIRPAKLWNDTSSRQECQAILEAAGGEEAYRQEIGNSLPPGFTASKILWVQRHEPDCYSRIRSILLPHEFLNFYLTGEKSAEPGDASGTGYFRVRQRTWSEKALSWIDCERSLADCLPPLIESSRPAGQLRRPLARKWGLPEGIPVSSGGGDNMMGAIGTGNVLEGIVTASLGTSGTLFAFSASAVVDPQGEVAAFCDSTGGWLPLACTMNVTVATDMVGRAFFAGRGADFERRIAKVPAGAGGLFLIPFLEGERLPNVPEGTGVLVGLRPATCRPEFLARAAVEGVTLGLYYGLQRLRSLGVRPAEVRLIGGGARSATWRQIVADIFALPVVTPKVAEGPAMGAALQALWCREGGDIRQWIEQFLPLNESSRIEPRPKYCERYQRLYQVYQTFSRALLEQKTFEPHRRLIESLEGEGGGEGGGGGAS